MPKPSGKVYTWHGILEQETPELLEAVNRNELQREGKAGADLKKVHALSVFIGKEKKRVSTLGSWNSCDWVYGLHKSGRYFVPKGVDAEDDTRILSKAAVAFLVGVDPLVSNSPSASRRSLSASKRQWMSPSSTGRKATVSKPSKPTWKSPRRKLLPRSLSPLSRSHSVVLQPRSPAARPPPH